MARIFPIAVALAAILFVVYAVPRPQEGEEVTPEAGGEGGETTPANNNPLTPPPGAPEAPGGLTQPAGMTQPAQPTQPTQPPAELPSQNMTTPAAELPSQNSTIPGLGIGRR